MSSPSDGRFRIERKQTLEQRKDEKKKLSEPVELQAGEIVLGTLSNCDLTLDDPVVASRHCAITCQGGRYSVRDLGSASGTYLNGIPVEGDVAISHGDRLVLGVTTIELQADPATQSCLLYTSPSPRDLSTSRMPSSA